LSGEKWEFIEDELIANAIHAAFQRGGVYGDSKDNENQRRIQLRDCLANLLQDLRVQYEVSVSSTQHEKNIMLIASNISQDFGDILRNGKMRIGTAQKALNLYLKYMWCLGKIATPPHCPFDGIVIDLLTLEKDDRNIRWTTMDTMDQYRVLVDAAEKEMTKARCASLAEWELRSYSGRADGVE
jgi:hypothetical protein